MQTYTIPVGVKLLLYIRSLIYFAAKTNVRMHGSTTDCWREYVQYMQFVLTRKNTKLKLKCENFLLLLV